MRGKHEILTLIPGTRKQNKQTKNLEMYLSARALSSVPSIGKRIQRGLGDIAYLLGLYDCLDAKTSVSPQKGNFDMPHTSRSLEISLKFPFEFLSDLFPALQDANVFPICLCYFMVSRSGQRNVLEVSSKCDGLWRGKAAEVPKD